MKHRVEAKLKFKIVKTNIFRKIFVSLTICIRPIVQEIINL